MNTKTLKTKKHILIILVIILSFVNNLSAQVNLGQTCNCDKKVEEYNESLKIFREAEKEYQKEADRRVKVSNELEIYIKNNNLDMRNLNSWTKEQQNYVLPHIGGAPLSATKEAQALEESARTEQLSKENMEMCLDRKIDPSYCQKCNAYGFIENDDTKINGVTCETCKDGELVKLSEDQQCCNGTIAPIKYTYRKTTTYRSANSSIVNTVVTETDVEPGKEGDLATGMSQQQANSFSLERSQVNVTVEKIKKPCEFITIPFGGIPIGTTPMIFNMQIFPESCIDLFLSLLGF